MVKKNRISQEERDYDDVRKMMKSLGPGSITLLVIVGFILTILIGYSLGIAHVNSQFINQYGVELSSSSNIGGQAYEADVNQTPVAEAIVFSDEVMISEEKCDVHVNCAPNGICFEGHCAYFLNG